MVRKALEQNQVVDEQKLLWQIPGRLLGKKFMLTPLSFGLSDAFYLLHPFPPTPDRQWP